MSRDELLAVLEAAWSEPIGILLQCDDPVAARMAFYKARSADPKYSVLQFRMWPHEDGNLAICHGPSQPPNHHGDLTGILDLDIEA